MSTSYIKPPTGELFNGQLPGSPVASTNNTGNYLIILFVGVAAGLIIYYVVIRVTRPDHKANNTG
jgi:hypothetical protein